MNKTKSNYNVQISGGTIGAMAVGPGASASSTMTTTLSPSLTPTSLSLSLSLTAKSPDELATYLETCVRAIRDPKAGQPPMPKGVNGSVSWVRR